MINVQKIAVFLSLCFISITSVHAQKDSQEITSDNYSLQQLNVDKQSDALIDYAYHFLRTPYRRGGMGAKGFDCSGFSSYVFKKFGYDLCRTSSSQARIGNEVGRKSLKKGDLVFFKGRNSKTSRVGHVGIVIDSDLSGEFTFIHASCGKGVTVDRSNKAYYKARYVTARRVLFDNSDPTEFPTTSDNSNRKSDYSTDQF